MSTIAKAYSIEQYPTVITNTKHHARVILCKNPFWKGGVARAVHGDAPRRKSVSEILMAAFRRPINERQIIIKLSFFPICIVIGSKGAYVCGIRETSDHCRCTLGTRDGWVIVK